jgi:hypothetical protein
MDLYDLPGVGDVVPMSIGLPAVGDNLNQDASGGRLWNMSNALPVGLDVEFRLFVFDQVIFLRLQVDACVFNRLVLIAPGDFDGDAGSRRLRGRFFGRGGLLRADGSAGRVKYQGEAKRTREPEKLHGVSQVCWLEIARGSSSARNR